MKTRTLEDIRAEIDALEAEYSALRESQMAEAREQIKRLMGQYGLSSADLAGLDKSKQGKTPRAPHKPMAYHFVSPDGVVWAGRGPRPAFFKGMEKEQLEQFKRAGAVPK